MRISTLDRLTLFSVACSGLVACSGTSPDVREVQRSRTYESTDSELRWNAGPEERFGMRRTTPRSAPPGWHWEVPDGWSEQPTTSLRLANFLVAGDERAECYLTTLVGDGGGLTANVDRWRGQMSLPSAAPEELEALARAELAGEPATVVDLEGRWVGMSGDAEGNEYRLYGLLQISAEHSRFLKMVGPKEILEGEIEAFHRLAESLHQDSDGHAHGHGADAAHSGSHPEATTSTQGQPFRWQAPEGWEQAPERAMRLVTFLSADGRTECYVTVLAGDGGGIAGNIRRWCEQMGATIPMDEEIEALERIPMLGGEGVLLDVTGRYRGMGDQDVPEARLLGAVRLLGTSSIFVKLIGPTDAVAAEREAFLSFCASLEENDRS